MDRKDLRMKELTPHTILVDMLLKGMLNEGEITNVAAIAAVYLTLAAEMLGTTREYILKESDKESVSLKKRIMN